MAEVVDAELRLEAIDGAALWHHHEAAVVDEDVDMGVLRHHLLRCTSHRLRRPEVDRHHLE